MIKMKKVSINKLQLAEYLICVAKMSFRDTSKMIKEIFDAGISNKQMQRFYDQSSQIEIHPILQSECEITKREIDKQELKLKQLQLKLKILNHLASEYASKS